MRPSQATGKRPNFGPRGGKFVFDIQYLDRGGGGVRLSSVRQRSSPFRFHQYFKCAIPYVIPSRSL